MGGVQLSFGAHTIRRRHDRDAGTDHRRAPRTLPRTTDAAHLKLMTTTINHRLRVGGGQAGRRAHAPPPPPSHTAMWPSTSTTGTFDTNACALLRWRLFVDCANTNGPGERGEQGGTRREEAGGWCRATGRQRASHAQRFSVSHPRPATTGGSCKMQHRTCMSSTAVENHEGPVQRARSGGTPGEGWHMRPRPHPPTHTMNACPSGTDAAARRLRTTTAASGALMRASCRHTARTQGGGSDGGERGVHSAPPVPTTPSPNHLGGFPKVTLSAATSSDGPLLNAPSRRAPRWPRPLSYSARKPCNAFRMQ